MDHSIWVNIPTANINHNQGLVTTTYPDGNGFETGYFAADHSIYIQVLNNQNNAGLAMATFSFRLRSAPTPGT